MGIGGIGVSALARHYLADGYLVTGSDMSDSEILRELQDDGALIYKNHQAENVPSDAELVIYSAAVQKDNPELKEAKKLDIKTLSYAEAIGELTKKYFTICISGSHGKSTTTALIGLILTKAGYDPTIIVGTKLKELNNKNYRRGESQYLVLEADEWNKSFLGYHPKMIVLTNIDNEHLDTYKNFKGVVSGFNKYLQNLSESGVLIANYKDRAIRDLGNKISKKKDKTVIFYNKDKFKKHPLLIPGEYNQVNAEAAYQTANFLGIKKDVTDSVFKEYSGAWRRMEFMGESTFVGKFVKSVKVFADYAHHPTEVRVTLKAFREKYPDSNIVCVFEPHQADRLMRLFEDFIPVFAPVDMVILMPAYKVLGREEKKNNKKDAFALAQEIKKRKKKVFYAPEFESAIKDVNNNLKSNSVVIFMGAGSIDGKMRKFLDVK